MKQNLSTVWTLTKMQLKEKMDVSYLHSFKEALFKIVFMIIQFVAITVICFLLLWAVKFLGLVSIRGNLPTGLLTLVFTCMFLLSTVFTTIGLVKSLYLSKDNLVLLTLPATPMLVFISKLMVYYVYEIRKNVMFLIPFFFAFGINAHYSILYFPWVAFLFVFIAALPVLLGALISIPSLYVYQFLRKRKWAQYVLLGLVFVGLGAATYGLVSILPEDINLVQNAITWNVINFLDGFEKIFLPFSLCTEMIAGREDALTGAVLTPFTWRTPILFFGFLLVFAALTAGCLLISKPLFYSMASKPFEFTKKNFVIERKNKKTPVFLSAIKKEWIVALRDTTIIELATQLIVIMPLAIMLFNNLHSAMSMGHIGTLLSAAFNLLLIMLFMLSANIRMSSAYSKDGFAAYLNKVQPSTSGALLFAKMTTNLLIGFIGLVITLGVYAFYAEFSFGNMLLLGLVCYGFYVGHLFWSGEIDLMHPQYDQYATFSEQSNNPNENKSSGLCFGLSFVVAIVAFLLSTEGLALAWIKIAIIAIAFAVFKIFTYFMKIKVYYKEK